MRYTACVILLFPTDRGAFEQWSGLTVSALYVYLCCWITWKRREREREKERDEKILHSLHLRATIDKLHSFSDDRHGGRHDSHNTRRMRRSWRFGQGVLYLAPVRKDSTVRVSARMSVPRSDPELYSYCTRGVIWLYFWLICSRSFVQFLVRPVPSSHDVAASVEFYHPLDRSSRHESRLFSTLQQSTNFEERPAV